MGGECVACTMCMYITLTTWCVIEGWLARGQLSDYLPFCLKSVSFTHKSLFSHTLWCDLVVFHHMTADQLLLVLSD